MHVHLCCCTNDDRGTKRYLIYDTSTEHTSLKNKVSNHKSTKKLIQDLGLYTV